MTELHPREGASPALASSAAARIEKMEHCFDTVRTALEQDPAVMENSAVFRALLRRLLDYYEGGRWLQDYALDEAGLLPPDLKRGILSQDSMDTLMRQIARHADPGNFRT